MSDENNKIEIVSGNVDDLNISPVYEHLSVAKPKLKKDNNKKVVIPKIKKTDNKKLNN